MKGSFRRLPQMVLLGNFPKPELVEVKIGERIRFVDPDQLKLRSLVVDRKEHERCIAEYGAGPFEILEIREYSTLIGAVFEDKSGCRQVVAKNHFEKY